jgi:hypothetical protein
LEDAEALISIPNFEVANAHWRSDLLGAFFIEPRRIPSSYTRAHARGPEPAIRPGSLPGGGSLRKAMSWAKATEEECQQIHKSEEGKGERDTGEKDHHPARL